jgi:aspartate/methionine/tyrosine aminotransferase
MTGWRLGYLVCPPHLAAIAATLQEPITSCASAVIQKGGEAALAGPQECVHRFRAVYRGRRDLVVEMLGPTGLLPVVPAGAFYALLDIGRSGQDSMSFAKSLLLAEGVAVVPGITFGPSSDRFVRIAYTAADRELRTGLERVRRYLLG